jgi:hypothetical protein
MALKDGNRIFVLFGPAGNKKSAQKQAMIKPAKRVADKFGLKSVAQKEIPVGKIPKGKTAGVPLKGHRDNAIKIPLPAAAGKKPKYMSLPVPSNATIKQIRDFIASKFTQNKPKTFISVMGRQHPTGL